jgi:predicted nucleic acid-binding Zn ribbon protein
MANRRLVPRKRCHYCSKFFIPDPRVDNRQKACSTACQEIRKRENNQAFSRNNPGYWRGRYEYVKEWRQRNPDYQKQWRQRKKAQKEYLSSSEIQVEIFREALDSIEKNLIVLRKIQAEIILKTIDITAKKASFTFQAS